MLLAFAKKLRAAATQTTPELPVGTLTRDEPYDHLRYGEIEGVGTVTIDRTGNMIGLSPVERCQDKHGETDWIPTNLIRNLRLNPFPVSGATGGTIGRPRKLDGKTAEGTSK